MEPKNYSEGTDSKLCTKLSVKAENCHASSVIPGDAEVKDIDWRSCGYVREAGEEKTLSGAEKPRALSQPPV